MAALLTALFGANEPIAAPPQVGGHAVRRLVRLGLVKAAGQRLYVLSDRDAAREWLAKGA